MTEKEIQLKISQVQERIDTLSQSFNLSALSKPAVTLENEEENTKILLGVAFSINSLFYCK